jgi:hypothetical protein
MKETFDKCISVTRNLLEQISRFFVTHRIFILKLGGKKLDKLEIDYL